MHDTHPITDRLEREAAERSRARRVAVEQTAAEDLAFLRSPLTPDEFRFVLNVVMNAYYQGALDAIDSVRERWL